MSAAKAPEVFKCSIGINGTYDLEKQAKSEFKRFKRYRSLLDDLYLSLGNPKDKSDKVRRQEQSPVNNADKIKAATLLIAGKRDGRVDYKQTKTMHKKLKKAKNETEYMEVEWAGHNVFQWRDDSREVYKTIEAFLEKHLK